ncbi:hypothetical protein [Alicyclobacillus sp. SO9]|uniref:hypothetical protein n=1 Tax=Alicyclobacillus sp. SO9 TaxID=2665646 RepID=UPI0018E89ADB|nr:hypothetical protein [Alicyclobacillus sp. SO9]QQE79830.1 hypothetical protein GI364_04915 [Alicyclobacillus sp. SO9]
MRTLKGYEAIELAERYDILLYKFTTQTEVTASEARDEVQNRGNASAYVIEAWPDSEEEAEQIILKKMEENLRTIRTSAATIEQLTTTSTGDRFMHPVATELAVDRLVEKGTLSAFRESNGDIVYVLSKRLAFTEDFLDRMRDVVCEECADLNLEGPFHETCLLDLFEFLHTYKLSLEDLREVTDLSEDTRAHGGQSISSSGMQWLSKTVSVTRSRWKTVLEPLLKNRSTDKPADTEADEASANPAVQPPTPTEDAEAYSDAVHTEAVRNEAVKVANPSPRDTANGRPKITKKELIQYLQSIEVLDEGELDVLREARDELLRDLDEKDNQIRQLIQQKSRLETQYAQLQQDMDVMVRAMRIARQHDTSTPTEIITAYESDQEA